MCQNKAFICLIFIAIITPCLVNSQVRLVFSDEIKWFSNEGNSELSTFPIGFENSFINDEKALLPLYSKIIPLKGAYASSEIELLNLVTEPIDENFFSNSQFEVLEEEFQYSSRVLKSRNDYKIEIEIFPFRLNSKGNVERLLSFEANIKNGFNESLVYKSKRAADNSVLGEGEWYKIAIAKDGVYQLDYNDLSNLGVDVENVNPEAINIYGNGGELLPILNSEFRYDDLEKNAILVSSGGSSSFEPGDFILFYGKGPDKWTLDTDENPNRYVHSKHYYSDSAYYFIRVDDELPKRIQMANTPLGDVTHEVSEFQDFQFLENNVVNLAESGREFYGEHFDATNNYNFNFSFPNVTNDSAYLDVAVMSRSLDVASSFEVSVLNESITITPNHVTNSTISSVANPGKGEASFTPQNDNITVNVEYIKSNLAAEGWLDYLRINASRELAMVGTQMKFRDSISVGTGNIARFSIAQSNFLDQVWDVSDITNVQSVELSSENGSAEFVASSEEIKEYIAFADFSFLEPRLVGAVSNQNLHALEDVDMIIISGPALSSQAEQFADIHREEGLVVETVQPMQVYNEFSSGNPDVTAIKMLMKMLYDKAGSDEDLMPKYLMFLGDGSYSGNKGASKAYGINLITYHSANSVSPTLSYVSDDYFAFLDDFEGENDALDVGVGRIPVKSASEANDCLRKLRIYLSDNTTADGDAGCIGDEGNSPFGSWRNTICFIADDQDGNGTPTEDEHMAYSDVHSNTIYQNYNDYNVKKIYMDAYQQVSTPGGERYPDGSDAIKREVEKGALIVNYFGHGGGKGWAHERILNTTTIQEWSNLERLPVFMTATCELARFDDPEVVSAGEYLVLNPNGGAIAMLTTTRIVFSGSNQNLATQFYDIALDDENNEDLRLGTIMMHTKNNASSSTNKRNFSLLGDPALKLSYPKHEVITTHVNGVVLKEGFTDTIKSLEQVEIRGFIRDGEGSLLSDFNGFVYPTVYDKRSEVTTLNNDFNGTQGLDYEFDVFKNIIYKGKASVVNGEFEFSFIVPRDINYNFGNGRVSYYAVDGSVDGHGHSENFVIGGALEDVELNTEGPEVNLYLNDSTFVFGGITDESPYLFAKVKDENGINTVGNGIGHDLKATLDGESNSQIILNDFYEADLDTYQSGTIRYQLTNLSEGSHQLSLKVWDVHNNSSESFTEFVVAPSVDLALDHVLNYPNPFTTRTDFYFEHNQACDFLNVEIQIFTVSGRLVKTIDNIVRTEGFRSEPIAWDGLDDFGDNIGKGVYVYRVKVETPEGLSAEEFEKLVILK